MNAAVEFILKGITYLSFSILALIVLAGIVDFIFLLLGKEYPPRVFKRFYMKRTKKKARKRKKGK